MSKDTLIAEGAKRWSRRGESHVVQGQEAKQSTTLNFMRNVRNSDMNAVSLDLLGKRSMSSKRWTVFNGL